MTGRGGLAWVDPQHPTKFTVDILTLILLKITGPEQTRMMNNWKREIAVYVCIRMTPFIGEDVLCIHVSYPHPKLGPVTFCMMIRWHLLLSLIL